MKLSILTPSIPTRLHKAGKLHGEIARQIAAAGAEDEVEHLILTDNRQRSIGAKRQALVEAARGDYVAFVDDDDRICEGYVAGLLRGIAEGVDVVTFDQRAVVNGQESKVVFQLGQGNGPFVPGGVTKRDAWHVCAWKRGKVAGCQFGESNYGEDEVWNRQARKRVRSEAHIPAVLMEYHHDAKETAAPPPIS